MNLKDPDPNNPVDAAARGAHNNRLDDLALKEIMPNTMALTEHKGAEVRVRFQARLLDAVGQAVIATDPEGRIIYWNRGAQELYGWSAKEAMGRPVVEVTPSEERAGEIMSSLMAGRSWSGEFTVRRKDGTTFPAMVTDTPVYDEQGNLVAIIGVSTDITEIRQTEELRRSEERFRSLAENAQDLIFRYRLKPTPGFEYVSPSSTAMIGYTPEEHYADPELGFKIVHPDDRHLIDEVLRYPESPITIRWLRKDGHVIWTEQRNKPIYDEAGELVVIEGIARDVTERKEAEEALKESERRFSTVVSSAHAFVYRCLNEPGYPNEYASDYALELTGYPPEDLLVGGGVRFGDLILEEDQNRVWQEIQKALGERRRFKLRYSIRRKDGVVRHVEEYGQGIYDEDGEVEVIEGLVYDVTETVCVEGRLREAEERYRTLVERIPVITYLQEANEPRRTTYISPQYERILGYSPEEDIANPDHWVKIIHPDDRERVEAADRRTNETGEPFAMEYRQFAKDGRTVWIRDEATLMRNQVGEPIYWLGVQTDVTERRRAEEALKKGEERHRSRSRELALLHRVRSALARELDEVGVLYRAVEAVARAYGYTQVSAYLLEHEELVLQHQVGYERVIERIPMDEGISGRAVRTERPVLVEDVSTDPDFLGAVEGVTSEVCVPLFDGGEAVGIINVESTSGVKLTQDDLRLMIAVGEHVGVAVSRARLHVRVRHSEEHYRALTQNSSDLVTLLGATGTIRYLSVVIGPMLGYFPEELLGKNIFDYVHPDDLQRVEMAFAEGLKVPERRPSVEYRFRHKDGSWVWLESVGTNLLGDPAVGSYVINSRDITERKEAEEVVRRSEESLSESQRLAHLGTWEWDVVEGKVWWSDETYRIYGFEPKAFVPTLRKLMEVVHPEDRASLRAAIDDAFRGSRPYDLEHRVVRPDGVLRVVHRRAEVVRGDKGDPLRMIGTVHDITERQSMEDQLKRQALHDALTGLPNRKLFVDRLGQALERTRRTRNRKVAVLFMDLDGFKVINDSLGHEIGDLLLVIVAERLRRCLRPEDTLARLGGDEFVVLIDEVENPDEAVRVAERITDELRRPFAVDGRELFVRVSIGIALGDARSKTTEDLVRDADTAMYRAKESDSSYTVFDPAMYLRAVGRLEIENDLRRAIEREEFVVHYQPIVDLDDGEVWGMEALVRWDHPERGLLDPEEFVPIAEESGLVVPMGESVLEEACLRAVEWQERHPRTPPSVMSVNLSARQLARPDLAETVKGVLSRTGFEGRCLVLDITETVYVRTLEGNTAVLDRLKAMGIRISIDDFGTGYSSLSYLKSLPADALKIDKAFVRGLGEDVEDTAIVRMVIDLAHTLGMEVIAEGVEEWAQAALLSEMGCDLAQGFYFSRPLPSEEVPDFLVG